MQLESLSLNPTKPNFCIFSVAFSNCGQQVIGGGSDGGLYIYDLTANRNTYHVPVETDTIDVNAVGFVDDTSNIMYSGADNGRIKASVNANFLFLITPWNISMTVILGFNEFRFGIVERLVRAMPKKSAVSLATWMALPILIRRTTHVT